MKRLPSEVSPRIATNKHPGFTRRESYSTLLTSGFPLWLRISAPSSRCWNVIAGNYRTRETMRNHRTRSPRHNIDYQGHFSAAPPPRYISFMSTGTGPARYKCAQCEQVESSCECEKFCCLCQSVIDIRL